MYKEVMSPAASHADVIAITNRLLCERPFLKQIERVCMYGPKAVILREKNLAEKEYEKLLQEVNAICSTYRIPCICHSFLEAAFHTGVRRIHLPMGKFRELMMEEETGVRGYFTEIGVSVHSAEEAREAQESGADYVTAGHIYPTDCKKDVPARGTGFLREVCESVQIPVYAIGGIRLEGSQIEEVKKCGARGACVMSRMMRI